MVGASAISLVYEGLVTFDRAGQVAPGLARTWTASEDGREWRFELDPDAKDSSGRPLGAADVLASFRRLLDPATASPRAWVLERIAGAEAFRNGAADEIAGLRGGDGEVTIRLDAPSSSFLGLLAMANAVVLPEGAEPDGRVATGPWQLIEHVRDSHLVFTRNPHWHGPAPELATLRVRILPEEFTRVAEWDTGRLDVLEVPSSQSQRFADAPSLVRQVALVTEYLGLNNADPVLRDVRVRRALNHAVNVDRILEHVLAGRGVRARGAVPPSLPGGGQAEPYAYDPSRARELLAAANVPADWELELWQRPGPLASQVLEAIQADLREVGVTCSIQQRDWSALKASIDRGETPAFFINWYADYPDAENFLVPLFHSRNVGGGGNRAAFRSAALDARLEELDRLSDLGARAEFAAALDSDILAEAPWVYLWHPVLEYLVSPRLEGFAPHPIPSAERWLDVRPAGAASS